MATNILLPATCDLRFKPVESGMEWTTDLPPDKAYQLNTPVKYSNGITP